MDTAATIATWQSVSSPYVSNPETGWIVSTNILRLPRWRSLMTRKLVCSSRN